MKYRKYDAKDGKNKVNSFQIDFHERFKGHCHVVRSSQEALEIMTKDWKLIIFIK